MTPCAICSPSSGPLLDEVCDKHQTFIVDVMGNQRRVSREEWNGSIPTANAVRQAMDETFATMRVEADRLTELNRKFKAQQPRLTTRCTRN